MCLMFMPNLYIIEIDIGFVDKMIWKNSNHGTTRLEILTSTSSIYGNPICKIPNTGCPTIAMGPSQAMFPKQTQSGWSLKELRNQSLNPIRRRKKVPASFRCSREGAWWDLFCLEYTFPIGKTSTENLWPKEPTSELPPYYLPSKNPSARPKWQVFKLNNFPPPLSCPDTYSR